MRLIDADAFKWWVNALYDCTELGQIVTEWINDRPTIDAEPVRRGRWEKLYQGNYKCSECGDWWAADDEEEIKTFRHCPNCGARMEEQE